MLVTLMLCYMRLSKNKSLRLLYIHLFIPLVLVCSLKQRRVIAPIRRPQVGGDLVLINHHWSPGHRLAGGLGQDGAVRHAVGGGGDGHGHKIKWKIPTVNF